MIGLELRDAGVVALLVDEQGSVRARATVDGSDLAAAARQAIEQLKPAPAEMAALGVAATLPESPTTLRSVESIAAIGGPSLQKRVVAAGTAAAIAEAWVGAARDVRELVYFAVGDHATSGIIRDGAAVTGAHGRAPAIAWLALNPVEREDYRKIGCLEAEVAAAGIVRRLIWRIKAGDRSRTQEMVNGDLAAITIDHIFKAARDGDGVSISVMRDTAKYLGMAAANLVVISDPHSLVLGGIMASAADLLLEPLRVELARRVPAAMMEALTVATASLGDDGPAIGAARYAAARP